jgi:aspartokinase
MAKRGCELVQAHALLAAEEANLPLVIRSLDERAPFTVISRDSKTGTGNLVMNRQWRRRELCREA